VPAVLKREGRAECQKHCDAFAKGANVFEFNAKIYGHATVKRLLVKAQHDKCCYCESKVTHISSGHIEHFRPKGGVRQRPADALEKPGYFWLAYEWTNLLFCCELCNSRYKKNLVPLAKAGTRARGPAHDVAAEQPLFIDPSREDPEVHIGFREEYPFAINGSSRGDATWRALGLDREELAELRRDYLTMVRALKIVRDGNGPAALRAQAAALLPKLMSDTGQWSSMVRSAIGAP
jgi:uncharacterized protein (TIGR02646 family)